MDPLSSYPEVSTNRLITSRRLLHRLRYTLVNSYFRDQRLQLTAGQIQDELCVQREPRANSEISSLLREGQRRLHPSVRKLLGKKTADLDEILFRSRAPRNKIRKDYFAMVQCKNYTISADATKSLRPDNSSEAMPAVSDDEPSSSRPKKVPRRWDPKITNVMTLDEATRNQMKYRYRIIIGNTSKYAPPASRLDRSTHKWLLYVRGPAARPDLTRLVSHVRVRLHHSYAPHHTVHIDKPPFHVSRRGWGEFPAQVELHFALPERNRPATIEHTIKLDRNYTGLQTLGAETIVDVWLYSTQEMLQFEYKESEQTDLPADLPIQPKIEPVDPEPTAELEPDPHTDNWLDFFSNTTELDVDEMIIKPTKKEERSDIENLIETNIIPKDRIEEDIPEINNHYEENSNTNQIKTEIQEHFIEDNAPEIQEDIPDELLSQSASPKKRIMKYMDPTTGKIYYLEMDRNLDLSKVQEIVINSKGNVKTAKISPIKSNGLKNVRKNTKKGGVSLLKPEIKSLLKKEEANIEKPRPILKRSFTHIENDHCYLGRPWSKNVTIQNDQAVLPETISIVKSVASEVKKEQSLYDCLCAAISRINNVRVAVNYLLKKMPLICSEAGDSDFVKCFPYVVENEDRYWRLDFSKRRNIEWSRAKLINKLLSEHFIESEPIWRTKQILIYSRLHGFYPIRTETVQKLIEDTEWSSWNDVETCRRLESNIKELYPNAADVSSLTTFDVEEFTKQNDETIQLTDSDEEIDIVNCDLPVRVKKEVLPDTSGSLTVLPVESDAERLRFLFIESKCADIGLELRNEDVGSGFSYSAVHAVMLSAVQSFAEELVRSSLANKLQEARAAEPLPPVWTGSSSSRTAVSLEHVYRAAQSSRLHVLSTRCLGVERKDTYFI